MRIALFHNLPKGGAKRAVHELISIISKKHTIDLYSFEGCVFFLALDKFCNEIFRFKSFKASTFLDYQIYLYKNLPKIHKKIAFLIDKRNYDVAFISADYLTKAPYVLRYLKTPSIYLCQEPPREFYENLCLYSKNLKYFFINLLRFPLKYVDIKNASRANYIMGNSDYSVKLLSKIYRQKVVLLRHGVNPVRFKFLKKKRENFFLTVGALSRFKGHDFLIKSISRLPRKLQYPLVIVADGGRDKKYIENIAQKLKVKLIIKSKITDKELVELYNKAKIFLFGAVNEPLGLVVLEAAACGLKTIAVRGGGLKDFVNRKIGVLIPRDECLLAEEIEKMLGSKFEHSKREALSRWIERRWNWSFGADTLIKYFNKAKRSTF